jgi:hypothetical protein
MVSADFQGLLYNKIKWRDRYKHCFIASGQPKDDFNAAILLQWCKVPAHFQSRFTLKCWIQQML